METEKDAIEALRDGNIAGLATLVRLHQLRALRTAFGITGDRGGAEDVVSEAFLRVFERIHKYDTRRPFEAWLHRIVVNLAIDQVRRMRRSVTVAEPAQSGSDASSADLDAQLDIAQVVRALPVRERAVIVLHYYLDLDERSIAAVLNCPPGTVKSRLHRARERMHRRLSDTDHKRWALSPPEGA
jgi:RNA polymerase sigma-70 factor, ECF subfamily